MLRYRLADADLSPRHRHGEARRGHMGRRYVRMEEKSGEVSPSACHDTRVAQRASVLSADRCRSHPSQEHRRGARSTELNDVDSVRVRGFHDVDAGNELWKSPCEYTQAMNE